MNAKNPTLKNSSIFNKVIPLRTAMAVTLLSGLIVYFFIPRPSHSFFSWTKQHQISKSMIQLRLQDYKFTHPLLLVDVPYETDALSELKEKISHLITKDKSMKMAKNISVYFRQLDDGSWFSINGKQTYSPASLMKVSFLIAILKQAESDTSLLDRKIYFEKAARLNYQQTIKTFSLEENKYYTIRELLYDMIVYSDNDALGLIARNTNQAVLNKMFSDLDITPPSTEGNQQTNYVVTVNEYCKLFRVLYSSSYLKDEYSDFALSLLSGSTYKGGMLKDIHPTFPVSHKFGERNDGYSQQLHEIGIFYASTHPYLLGIMTEGDDQEQQSSVLSEVSKIVYQTYSTGN
jgi:beta-lactamase class A